MKLVHYIKFPQRKDRKIIFRNNYNNQGMCTILSRLISWNLYIKWFKQNRNEHGEHETRVRTVIENNSIQWDVVKHADVSKSNDDMNWFFESEWMSYIESESNVAIGKISTPKLNALSNSS